MIKVAFTKSKCTWYIKTKQKNIYMQTNVNKFGRPPEKEQLCSRC